MLHNNTIINILTNRIVIIISDVKRIIYGKQ